MLFSAQSKNKIKKKTCKKNTGMNKTGYEGVFLLHVDSQEISGRKP